MAAINGRLTRVLDFLKNNPGMRSAHIARAMNDDPREVSHSLTRLVKNGLAQVHGEGLQKKTYTAVANPEPAKMLKVRSDMGKREIMMQPKVRAQTSDEFIALGGTVEKLPASWSAAPHARPSGHIQIEGRARAH